MSNNPQIVARCPPSISRKSGSIYLSNLNLKAPLDYPQLLTGHLKEQLIYPQNKTEQNSRVEVKLKAKQRIQKTQELMAP